MNAKIEIDVSPSPPARPLLIARQHLSWRRGAKSSEATIGRGKLRLSLLNFPVYQRCSPGKRREGSWGMAPGVPFNGTARPVGANCSADHDT
jgi:hypothetical protein